MNNIKNMENDVVYRVTKGNTDGGIKAGDIVSLNSKTLIVWAGRYTGAYDKTDLKNPKITDFDFEVADDYRIFKTIRKISCKKI